MENACAVGREEAGKGVVPAAGASVAKPEAPVSGNKSETEKPAPVAKADDSASPLPPKAIVTFLFLFFQREFTLALLSIVMVIVTSLLFVVVVTATAAVTMRLLQTMNLRSVSDLRSSQQVYTGRALFTLAAKISPTTIFVDEVDSMLGQQINRLGKVCPNGYNRLDKTLFLNAITGVGVAKTNNWVFDTSQFDNILKRLKVQVADPSNKVSAELVETNTEQENSQKDTSVVDQATKATTTRPQGSYENLGAFAKQRELYASVKNFFDMSSLRTTIPFPGVPTTQQWLPQSSNIQGVPYVESRT
ncbi:uncharacterized protein LOC109838483 [Asparagus officinalis]|uniref:uncharacterized protein LOC109838483 n=1 Tax=Asparagus officinalis TaxID=4686 RepID=UPI00098E8312|nr:uncharacterized protein LOC109838483 [Asparagus officinalis]